MQKRFFGASYVVGKKEQERRKETIYIFMERRLVLKNLGSFIKYKTIQP